VTFFPKRVSKIFTFKVSIFCNLSNERGYDLRRVGHA
jgi:hypothetical protein